MDEFVFPWLRELFSSVVKEKANLFNGVEDKVNSLEAELQLIDIFLKNSEAKQKDEMEEEVVRQMKEVASEAEDVIARFRLMVTEHRSRGMISQFLYSLYHAKALLYVGKKTVAIKEKTNEIFNNKRKYGTEIVEKKRKRQPLAQPADNETPSSSRLSQPAFSSKEVENMQPKRRCNQKRRPSAQQSGSYDTYETQDPQAKEPSLFIPNNGLYQPILPQAQVHDESDSANGPHLLTNLDWLVNPQFNLFPIDEEHGSHSTHALDGWDPECDATQEPHGQDHGTYDTYVPVDRVLDSNEVQTIDEDGNFHERTVGSALNMWGIPKGERVVVEFNPAGLPIGLSGQKMHRLAEGYVRSGNIVGIGADNWKQVLAKRKEEIWNMLMMKFYVPPYLPIDEIKRVIFMDFGKNMRNYKAHFKKSLNLQDSDTMESVVQTTPNVGQFDAVDFECTIHGWLTKEDIERAEKNRQIRRKHNMQHSAGSRSYAYDAHEFEKKGITSTREVIYDVTHTRMDDTFINVDIADKVEEMRALSSQDSAASSISTQGSIQWVPDDAYDNVMDKEEYSGHVRRTGPRPLPVKGRTRANRSSASSSQVPLVLERINAQQKMITALTEKHTRQDGLISSLTDAYNNVHKLMETILASQGTNNVNKCPPQDIESPGHVRVPSSDASQPGIR